MGHDIILLLHDPFGDSQQIVREQKAWVLCMQLC